MTPEKLEKIAEYHDDMAKLYGVDDRPAGSEWFAQVAAFLRRLAAKMREPDGTLVYLTIAESGEDIGTLFVPAGQDLRGSDSMVSRSFRPILYLDSLAGSNE